MKLNKEGIISVYLAVLKHNGEIKIVNDRWVLYPSKYIPVYWSGKAWVFNEQWIENDE